MTGDVFIVRYRPGPSFDWTCEYYRDCARAMRALASLRADSLEFVLGVPVHSFEIEVWRFHGPAVCVVDGGQA